MLASAADAAPIAPERAARRSRRGVLTMSLEQGGGKLPAISPDARPVARRVPTVRQADVALGLVLLVLGLLIVYGSWDLSYSGRAGPGPGFLPRWLGIGLALAGAGLLVSRLRARGREDEPLALPGERGLVRVGLVLATLVGLALTFTVLGFLVATAAMIFVLLFVMERESLPRAAGLAVLLPLLTYLLFKTWLGLKLPAGLVGF